MIIYEVNTDDIRIDIKSRPKLEPILWYRQGLFCVIPIQIVQNAIDNLEMYEKFSSKHTHPIVSIKWDQGILVDPKVGYALMGK